LADSGSNEVDFIVKIKKDQVILVESKYINLQESIVNSINKAFLKDYFGKKIQKRIIVTDGVDKKLNVNNVNVESISLEGFLDTGRLTL
jgi:hypothetical protein